jgi:hypothetical protein
MMLWTISGTVGLPRCTAEHIRVPCADFDANTVRFWEATAVPELRSHAARLAARLLP